MHGDNPCDSDIYAHLDYGTGAVILSKHFSFWRSSKGPIDKYMSGLCLVVDTALLCVLSQES